ncbi:hypothetical protein [Magnetospira sp. QH-2]|uniref:hypothetical protein n=1 Tax=Magnetospira sp. (strain QH-2) TaxID=1288970 RepID=UPI0003E81133|nr:hypothetical protein [Magnetospira sp. QH-2]CCQ72312.1 protein of unknown function [Magnetospira sp. QH-2]
MDGPELTDNPIGKSKQTRKWRRRFLVLVGLFLVLRYVPFIPHAPTCDLETFGTGLNGDYHYELASGFVLYDVPFYSVGNRVFLTVGGWLDWDNWVLNAMNQIVYGGASNAAKDFPESNLGKAHLALVALKQRIESFERGNDLARKEGRPVRPYWEEFDPDTWVYGVRRARCAIMSIVVTPSPGA